MLNFFIITSSEDIASMNIRDKLLNSDDYSFKELSTTWKGNPLFKLEKSETLIDTNVYLGLTDERLIFLNDLKLDELNFKPDFLIFASRHASKSARPALLIHTTGNWSNEAEFGGNPKEISYSSALLLKAGFLALLEESRDLEEGKYSVDFEVNHHGPTNHNIPLIFMELGSVEEEWQDQKAGKSVANAIVNAIEKYLKLKSAKNIIGIGFGGTHYTPQFKKLIRNTNVALAHICPKYSVQIIDKNIVKQIIEKTIEGRIDYFVFDWKGLNSQDKSYLTDLLKDFNIEIKRAKDFQN
jgi:D-aminoacyl-tRNA deacylase